MSSLSERALQSCAILDRESRLEMDAKPSVGL